MSNQARELNQLQPGLGTRLHHIISLINEIRDDQGTDKTTIDALRTAVVELMADHATNKLTIDGNRTVAIELRADHETTRLFDEAVKTFINTINDTVHGICAKLDADAGVTDTNYAATWGIGGSEGNAAPADVSSSPPATLTATDPPASADALSSAQPSASANTTTARKVKPLR